jgi:hypothetical protein
MESMGRLKEEAGSEEREAFHHRDTEQHSRNQKTKSDSPGHRLVMQRTLRILVLPLREEQGAGSKKREARSGKQKKNNSSWFYRYARNSRKQPLLVLSLRDAWEAPGVTSFEFSVLSYQKLTTGN